MSGQIMSILPLKCENISQVEQRKLVKILFCGSIGRCSGSYFGTVTVMNSWSPNQYAIYLVGGISGNNIIISNDQHCFAQDMAYKEVVITIFIWAMCVRRRANSDCQWSNRPRNLIFRLFNSITSSPTWMLGRKEGLFPGFVINSFIKLYNKHSAD